MAGMGQPGTGRAPGRVFQGRAGRGARLRAARGGCAERARPELAVPPWARAGRGVAVRAVLRVLRGEDGFVLV